jgi:outer membrane putative beta-barrel porin/alpha-amylase
MNPFLRATVLAMAAAAGVPRTFAQELEPRAYSPNPTGANVVLLAYGHSSGDIVFNDALPFSDVEASLNSTSLLYVRTFGLFGRSASAALGLPYVWGSVRGNVGDARNQITRSGLADARFRFSMNLVGGPALPRREFAARRPGNTLGMSLIVGFPSGQYDPAKLINIGSNRWSVKPELGFSHPAGRFVLELYGGVWFFTANPDFFGGSRRGQDPIGTLQGHASYTFRPRLWLAGDATFYTGGRTTLDGFTQADVQENSRLGLVLALPTGRQHSLKLAATSGFTTRIGGDFKTFSIAWQVMWFGRP